MKTFARFNLTTLLVISAIAFSSIAATAQDPVVVLTGRELTRVVPPGFYFEGLSAPTQMRNAAAARLGAKRHVIAGLVDTSGYSVEVRAKYEGFFITDSKVEVGGKDLDAGAYGFGFSDDGKFNVYDVGGKLITSAAAMKDSGLRRPRPLMMMKSGEGVRLYSGRDYVSIKAD